MARPASKERAMNSSSPDKPLPARHLVLFDGGCAFCRRSIELARSLDTHGRFDFQPYQSASHPLLTPKLKERCQGALHIITRRNRVIKAGRACFFLLEEATDSRLVKRLARLARSFPLVIPVEIGYSLVARNRTFFSKFF
jgi:predicted DCC family thiol-disulfide oxidoreductase YuxK